MIADSIVLDNMGLDGVKLSVRRSFYFAWITSLFGAAATYYLLARFFPQKSYVMNKNEKWGEWTQDKVEAWGAARRRGDRDGAEMFDETLEKESEVVMDVDEKAGAFPQFGAKQSGSKSPTWIISERALTR